MVPMAGGEPVELVGVGAWGIGGWGRAPRAGWVPPIPVRRLPAPQQVVYEAWHRWRFPPVQLVTGRVDLVHATTITVPPRRRRVPLAVTVHDLFPLDHPDQFTPRGLAMMQRGIDLARSDADVVLCSSRSTMDRCVEAGFEPARLRHVPLGVAPSDVSSGAAAAVCRRLGLERPFVLWVGTVEPRKNLATLVAAVARLPAGSADLVLVGPGGWHVDLEELVAPVRDRVRLLGAVDDAELAALNAAATVAALPSHAEGFGLTALEAMVQGTPVVVSSGSASEEVVGDAGIVVPATDVDAWAEALEALLGDPERRSRVGFAGRARAGTFTWERCAVATLDAYRSVVH
jgi:glycosyltransferase involved in cell wall biosynthesis